MRKLCSKKPYSTLNGSSKDFFLKSECTETIWLSVPSNFNLPFKTFCCELLWANKSTGATQIDLLRWIRHKYTQNTFLSGLTFLSRSVLPSTAVPLGWKQVQKGYPGRTNVYASVRVDWYQASHCFPTVFSKTHRNIPPKKRKKNHKNKSRQTKATYFIQIHPDFQTSMHTSDAVIK